MNYILAIKHRADELNEMGHKYLDPLPFMDNHVIIARLFDIARQIDASPGENPEWVDQAMDGHIPYAARPRNGSLYMALGTAIVAKDALLRNFLEVQEGREENLLTFRCVAEQEVVDKYSDFSDG